MFQSNRLLDFLRLRAVCWMDISLSWLKRQDSEMSHPQSTEYTSYRIHSVEMISSRQQVVTIPMVRLLFQLEDDEAWRCFSLFPFINDE